MSAAASIKFTQGATTPPAGQALDGVVGTAVSAINNNDTGIASWAWTLCDVPPGSAVPPGSLGTSAAMNLFTPDLSGSYLVKLVTTDTVGLITAMYLAVMIKQTAVYANRYLPPSFASVLAEQSLNIAGQTRGFAPFLESYLKVIDRLGDVGGSAPTNGQVLAWSNANSRYEPATSGSSAVADDIASSAGTTIDRVQGLKGVPMETGDTLADGETWVKRGTKLRAAKPVPPGWFNVVDYGAVGDGTADDTAAINAAIAAANAAGGGTVYCPKGRYKITAQLTTLGECVHLLGVSPEGSSLLNGTTFETYCTDTALYMGEFNDFNWSTFNSVSRIAWICKVNTEATYKKTIVDATNATPIVIQTSAAHGYATGHKVRVYGVLGNGAANSKSASELHVWTITVIDAAHYSLNGSVGSGAFVTDLSNTSPIVATTSSAHGLTTGDVVEFREVAGNLNASGFWRVTVIDATHYSLDGSTTYAPYVNNATSFDQLAFNVGAGAAIEARGATDFLIQDCKFIEYPLGIVQDGSETSVIERCLFGGAGGGPGYGGLGNSARGIWFADGASRGRGFTLGGTTNDHRVHSCVFGSYADNIYVQGGVAIRIRDCNFEGGRSAIDIGGPDILAIVGCTMENYTQYLLASGNSQTVRIEDCFLGGNNTSLKVVGGVSFLTMTNNNLGCHVPISGGVGYCIIGAGLIARCIALNNWNSRPNAAFADGEPGGYSISANYDYDHGDAGLAVNRLGAANAMLDGRVLDSTKPIFKVAGNYVRFQHDSKSEQHHRVKYGSASALTGTERGGLTGSSESARLLGAGAAVALAAFPFPDQTLAVVSFTVVQFYDNDPTKHAIWRCSQSVYRYSGAITFIGALNDDVAPNVTDAGFAAHPTLLDDGSGNVVVHVSAHTTVDSHVQVAMSVLAAGR
jgi:hypothetical protein